jgi:hypothetical protein
MLCPGHNIRLMLCPGLNIVLMLCPGHHMILMEIMSLYNYYVAAPNVISNSPFELIRNLRLILESQRRIYGCVSYFYTQNWLFLYKK